MCLLVPSRPLLRLTTIPLTPPFSLEKEKFLLVGDFTRHLLPRQLLKQPAEFIREFLVLAAVFGRVDVVARLGAEFLLRGVDGCGEGDRSVRDWRGLPWL